MCACLCVLTGIRTNQYDQLMRWWSSNTQSGIAQVLDSDAYCDVILPLRPFYISPHCSYHTSSSAHLGVPCIHPSISDYHTRLFSHLDVSCLLTRIPTPHPSTWPPSGSYCMKLYLNIPPLLSDHNIPSKVPQSCFYVASWHHQASLLRPPPSYNFSLVHTSNSGRKWWYWIAICFSWKQFVRLRDRNATLVVFKDCREEIWIWKLYIKNKRYLLHQFQKRYYFEHCLDQYDIFFFCCT